MNIRIVNTILLIIGITISFPQTWYVDRNIRTENKKNTKATFIFALFSLAVAFVQTRWIVYEVRENKQQK